MSIHYSAMKKRAPKRPAQERRRLILEGAHAVFADSGYTKANTTKVGKAAGVSAAALYRYFPSKKHLYISTLKAAGPRLLEIWKRTATAARNPLDAMWTIGLGYYDHVRSRSSVTRLWFRALGETDDPKVRAALGDSFIAAVDLLEKGLEAGKAQGVVRRDVDSRVAAWHFMAIGLTFDLIHLLHRDEELDRRKVEAWGNFYLDSIREKPRGAGKRQGRTAGGAVPLRQSRRQDLR
ncbi:MAG: TetR/AcrR family transcriptional regulator [Candidatus Binatia bacterium]